MWKSIVVLSMGFGLTIFPLAAQDKTINQEMCGTYMLYPIPEKVEVSTPQGYEPIFINHVGRHGSRFPVSKESLEFVKSELEKQGKQNNLTKEGQSLLINIDHIIERCENNWGELSVVGAEELSGIAQRLRTNYGSKIFRKVRCWVDPQNRCVSSYEHFFKGISELLPFSPIIDETKMVRQNNILNFFVSNQSYDRYKKSGNWISEYKLYQDEQLSNVNLLKKYLKDEEGVSAQTRRTFDLSLFSIWAITPNIPLSDSERPLIDIQDLKPLWRVQNARQYLEKGPSPIGGGIQQNISIPLLKQFIETSEENLRTKEYGAFMRFAHAETIIPFAALLKIPEASEATDITADIVKIWKDYDVAPMAANIIWVFYQNKEGDVLVKMMLNEREVAFPILTDNFPFYEWSKVKRYYQDLYSF